MLDNPLSTDDLINSTLEHLRRNVRIGISRGDEQQIEQTMLTMANLVQVYGEIDYASHYSHRTHAHLAAGYLSDAVKSVSPHNMADVLMEGVRLIGQSAHYFITRGESNDIVGLCNEIGIIATIGILNEKNRPVDRKSVV